MEQKLFSKIFIFILYFHIRNVCARQTDESPRARKIDSHPNSLFMRDVIRLAKAADMRNYMNTSVDPCKDFYEFSCGNWAKINPTTTQTETGYLFQLIQGIKRKKLELLQLSSAADPLETPVEKKVKDFYRSCIKAENVKRNTYRVPLLKLIAEFGTMPAFDAKAWNATAFDWMETIAKIKRDYGIPIILTSTIMTDMKNNTINRFYIGKPSLHLKVRSIYLNDDNKRYRDSYRDEIVNELIETMELPNERALQIANEVINFEIELAKGFSDEKADSSLTREILATSVEEMQQKYAPVLDIKKYVLTFFGQLIEGPIYEMNAAYQENLVKVINATSKETLANYIFYRLLTSMNPDKTGTGVERMKYCEKVTEMIFAQVMENMVYRRFDSRQTERDINLIFKQLKQVFKDKFRSNELNWISLKTRQIALRKLDAIKLEITYYMDMNFTEIFGDIQINDSNFFENLKNTYRKLAKNEKLELYKPKPKKQMGLSFTPLFSYKDNTIKVPVALLQPNYFWSPSYPKALMFGTIGVLLGHELVHGFADHGLQFDELGNQNDWWDENSMAAFRNRVECFRDQYHRYIYGNTFLPRAESQAENVADNGGLRLAYDAYLSWRAEAERNGDDFVLETLPLLKYNDKQLFFLSFGQVWCTEVDSMLRAMKVATDEHTPGKFRVIGTISNFVEFSKEFNCKANDAMNPNKRCVIY